MTKKAMKALRAAAPCYCASDVYGINPACPAHSWLPLGKPPPTSPRGERPQRKRSAIRRGGKPLSPEKQERKP